MKLSLYATSFPSALFRHCPSVQEEHALDGPNPAALPAKRQIVAAVVADHAQAREYRETHIACLMLHLMDVYFVNLFERTRFRNFMFNE